jgi:hypothetical protein
MEVEVDPHPMMGAVLQQELQLVWMRRDIHGDHGEIWQEKRETFCPGTKQLWSLKKVVAESWHVSTKQSAFFELSMVTTKNAAEDSPNIFSTLTSFDPDDFERIPDDPIESVVSFIKENRCLKPKPWWAKKTTIKAWRENHQEEFLKSLSKPERREIKNLESNTAQYAACFLHQLRQKQTIDNKKK